MSSERVESQGFFEMLWDCDHCETKGLLAKSQRHCPECGAPQSAIKRYFPKPEEQKQVVGHSYEGADRHCPACNAPMGAKAKACTQCGSPLDGSKQVEGVKAPVASPKKKRRIWPYVLAAIALLVFAIWWLFLRTKDAQVTVAAHHWERSVAIEEFGNQEETAWRDAVPTDASPPLCVRKQRSTKKVPDGEECHIERVDKKDGTFEQLNKCKPKYRSEPVEDDWCTYTVRRWKKIDEARVKGDGTSPTWPAQIPPADTVATFGAKRSGPRSEKLILDFGGGKTCEVGDATWRKYTDGQKAKVEVRARSGEIVCSSL
jgi:hypothetical protein